MIKSLNQILKNLVIHFAILTKQIIIKVWALISKKFKIIIIVVKKKIKDSYKLLVIIKEIITNNKIKIKKIIANIAKKKN